jgi:hypothetical protein
MCQLLRRTSGVYVTGIKIDLVAGCKDVDRFAPAVVLGRHVIFCLRQGSPGFREGLLHSLLELID